MGEENEQRYRRPKMMGQARDKEEVNQEERREEGGMSSDKLTSLVVTTLCGRTTSSLLPNLEYQALSSPSRPHPSVGKKTHVKGEQTELMQLRVPERSK